MSIERNIHRIGGSSIENLRLKPKEATLDFPGISVLRVPTPGGAARTIRVAFPKATNLHEAAKVIGTTSEQLVHNAGFDIMPAPSKLLPDHCRIIHADGAAGFCDENLVRLAEAFVDTTGH